MGESYLSHSVLHEKVLALRKLFVHLVHRPKVKSQESYRPVKTQGLCDPLVKRVGTVAYISNGAEHASAVQYGITESYQDTINHFPDKKSGRAVSALGL